MAICICAYLRDVVRNYVRPVTWLDAPADKGPKLTFVDHHHESNEVKYVRPAKISPPTNTELRPETCTVRQPVKNAGKWLSPI